MDARLLVAREPEARKLGALATTAVLEQLGPGDVSPERRADVEQAQAALIGLRARMALDPAEAALLATMVEAQESRLELALDAVRMDRAWREIDARDAFVAGIAQGAAAGARVLGPIALRLALAAVVA